MKAEDKTMAEGDLIKFDELPSSTVNLSQTSFSDLTIAVSLMEMEQRTSAQILSGMNTKITAPKARHDKTKAIKA